MPWTAFFAFTNETRRCPKTVNPQAPCDTPHLDKSPFLYLEKEYSIHIADTQTGIFQANL
jgi:hypothetical protein